MNTFGTIHSKFQLNGSSFTKEELLEKAIVYSQDSNPYNQHIGHFLVSWFDTLPTIKVKTSGSTGVPKKITLSKQAMVDSAKATGVFFNLKPGNTALLCMSTEYIAGKMMWVRAFVLGLALDIVLPSEVFGTDTNKSYDFVAMVPLQVEKGITQLERFKKIIIGGAPIHSNLKHKLQSMPIEIYETYGMTETITHIAAKRITEQNFKALPFIKFRVDDRNCLVIDAPRISEHKIVTNDIVNLHSETELEWLGRYDTIINSGGIKLFPEQIEAKLQYSISKRFFVTSEKDEKLGQRVVLVIESREEIEGLSFAILNPFEKPKKIYYIDAFVETGFNKIDKKNTLLQIQKA